MQKAEETKCEIKKFEVVAEILLKYAYAATKAAYTQLERAAAPASSFAVKKIPANTSRVCSYQCDKNLAISGR